MELTGNISLRSTFLVVILIAGLSILYVINNIGREIYSLNRMSISKSTLSYLKHFHMKEDEVYTCTPTPYVQCETPSANVSQQNETFFIAMLRRPTWMQVGIYLNLSGCEYTNCRFQGEKINESTRMVLVEVVNMNDMFAPRPRWPHQLYVATTWESPPYTALYLRNGSDRTWNNKFNLTATYRLDADIFTPYGTLRYQPPSNETRPDYYSIAKEKTKWALWHVSNCNPPSKRQLYVEEMQKIIDVDIFGRCGKPCNKSGDMCSDDKPMKYRYYLSFENTFCTDYVTEKFFKLFAPDIHIIPVVRGSFNYSKYLPKNTFIDASRFKNATELALYLKWLAEDHVTFSKILETKDKYRRTYDLCLEPIGCNACRYLNTMNQNMEKRIDNLTKWMVDGVCHEPYDL